MAKDEFEAPKETHPLAHPTSTPEFQFTPEPGKSGQLGQRGGGSEQRLDNINQPAKPDVATISDAVRPHFNSSDNRQNINQAAQDGRLAGFMGPAAPRNMTFSVDGKNAMSGMEFRQNGQPMLLSHDRQVFQGTLGADGKSIVSWQPMQNGKPSGEPLRVIAEKSGGPPEGVSANKYMEVRQNTNDRTAISNQNQIDQIRFGSTQEQPQQLQRPYAAQQVQNQTDRNIVQNQPEHKSNQISAQQEFQSNQRSADGNKPQSDLQSNRHSTDGNKPQQELQSNQRGADGNKPQGNKPAGDQLNDTKESNPGKNPQNSNKIQISNELKYMDPKQRLDLIDKASNHINPKVDSTHPLKGEISLLVPGKVTDGNPSGGGGGGRGGIGGGGGGGSSPDATSRIPAGKPGDVRGDGKGGGGGVGGGGDSRGEGKGGKSHDILPNQIEGKLLAQLQNLGRFPDVRKSFVDLITKFQEGKLTGKEATILQGIKGLDGLKAWLIDGKKNPFDFKGLDTQTQLNISKIFDTLLGRRQDKSTTAMLDVKGLRDTIQDRTSPLSRTLGGEKAQSDFKLNLKELDPVLQGILARLLGKDFDNSRDRTLTSKLDGKDIDGKPGIKLNEAVKDALSKSGEVTRYIGPRDTDTQTIFAPTHDTKTNPLAPKESPSKSTEKKRGQDLTPEQVKALLAEHKNAELEEAKQKKQDKEQEKQENDKKGEKRKQSDEERPYIVLPNDTLNSISEKFFKTKDYAQIIYDRNLADIMLQEHKNQTYAKLYTRQRIIIPNSIYIERFKKSTKSHGHINFGKVDYGSAEEELMAMFGKRWAGSAAEAQADSPTIAKEDKEQIAQRKFSGKSPTLSDTRRKANIHAALGISSQHALRSHKQHKVHLGESLRSIAQKLYKSPSYWRLIAIKNNLSIATDQRGNPVTLLSRGQQLILPEPSELESFLRNPKSPAVVVLSTNKRGLDLPRCRQCGNCHRLTLAMASNCVSCGFDMDTYAPSDIAADEKHHETTNKPANGLTKLQEVVEQLTNVQLQNVTLTNKFQPLNFNAEHPHAQEEEQQSIAEGLHQQAQEHTLAQASYQQAQEHTTAQNLHPQMQKRSTADGQQPDPPHDPHPLPHAEISKLEFAFEEADPMWTANPVPTVLDQYVQVVETETMEGDLRGLVVALKFFKQGEWLSMLDYHVFPDEVIIHKYQHKGSRRTLKKSLPAKQSKQMAWNHFRNNWNAIYKEYWTS